MFLKSFVFRFHQGDDFFKKADNGLLLQSVCSLKAAYLSMLCLY